MSDNQDNNNEQGGNDEFGEKLDLNETNDTLGTELDGEISSTYFTHTTEDRGSIDQSNSNSINYFKKRPDTVRYTNKTTRKNSIFLGDGRYHRPTIHNYPGPGYSTKTDPRNQIWFQKSSHNLVGSLSLSRGDSIPYAQYHRNLSISQNPYGYEVPNQTKIIQKIHLIEKNLPKITSEPETPNCCYLKFTNSAKTWSIVNYFLAIIYCVSLPVFGFSAIFFFRRSSRFFRLIVQLQNEIRNHQISQNSSTNNFSTLSDYYFSRKFSGLKVKYCKPQIYFLYFAFVIHGLIFNLFLFENQPITIISAVGLAIIIDMAVLITYHYELYRLQNFFEAYENYLVSGGWKGEGEMREKANVIHFV